MEISLVIDTGHFIKHVACRKKKGLDTLARRVCSHFAKKIDMISHHIACALIKLLIVQNNRTMYLTLCLAG